MIARILLVALLAPVALAAPTELPEVGERLLARIAAERAGAGVPPLRAIEGLDAMALVQAAEIAAMPHDRRLAHDAELDRDALRALGIRRYREVTAHTDMHRGYPNHDAAFFDSMRKYRPIAERMVDPDVAAMGAAVVRADDGWVVLVTLFVIGLDFEVDRQRVARDVLDAVNAERVARGLGALEPDRALDRLAEGHSREMARHDFFDHEDRAGRRVSGRAEGAKIRYRRIGENLFLVQGDPDPARRAAAGWMESEGHRANILTPGYRRTGVGVAVDDEGKVYITQVFLEPFE